MAHLLPDFERLEETLNAQHRISQQDAELQQREAEIMNIRHRLSQQDTQLRQLAGAEVLKIRNVEAAQIADIVAIMRRDAAITRTEDRAFRAEMVAFREESRNESRAFRAEMGAFREETGVNLVHLGRLTAARDSNVYARLENSAVCDFSMAFSVLRCLRDLPELEIVTNDLIPGFPENGLVLHNMQRPRLLVCLQCLEILFVEDDTTPALKRKFRRAIGVRQDIEGN